MADRYGHVHHGAGDAVTGIYRLGATNVAVPPHGILDLVSGPRPELGLYLVTDAAPTPLYHVFTGYAYAFEGVAGEGAARVVETRQSHRLAFDELYTVKLEEIAAQDRRVRYNAVDTALSVNWWLVVTARARSEISSTDRAALHRKIDGAAWPGGANAPFVGIFNAATGEVRRYQIAAQATWETLMLENAQHDQACGAATDASRLDLDAKAATVADPDDTSDPGWDLVAAHDPTDPAYGYPPTVELPPEARVLLE